MKNNSTAPEAALQNQVGTCSRMSHYSAGGRGAEPSNSGLSRSIAPTLFSGALGAFLLLSSFILLTSSFASAAPVRTQQIPLRANWNLISLQAGGTITVQGFKNSIPTFLVPGDPVPKHPLIEIWSYAPSSNPNKTGAFTSWQPTIANYPNDLTTLQPGKGYWVNVSQNCTATLTGEAWTGPVVFNPGWNLVGFPGLTLAENEVQSLASVFGADLGRISQVWTFAPATQTFPGYDLTSIPVVKSLNGIGPGLGYWIYALDKVISV